MKWVSILAVLCLLGGCTDLRYYGHVISGQVDLLARAQPIDELIENPGTDLLLRERLQRVEERIESADEQLPLQGGGPPGAPSGLGR